MMIMGMLNEQYHAAEGISSSAVKTVANSTLAHWKGEVRESKTAFDLGTAVHSLVLEPHLDNVVCGPDDRRSVDWKAKYRAATMNGQLLLTSGDFEQARSMSGAVLNNENVRLMLENKSTVIEASFFADDPDTGVKVKTRPDAFVRDRSLVIDIKTTLDASPAGFQREIRKYGYDMQAAFYLRTLRLAGEDADQFMFVAVEKKPPYAVCIHILSDAYLQYAHERVIHTLHRIAQAEAAGEFPTDWPAVNVVQLPQWLADTTDDFSNTGE
jgi:hypothetical protein